MKVTVITKAGITLFVLKNVLVPILPKEGLKGWKGAVRVPQTIYYSRAGLREHAKRLNYKLDFI